MGLQFSYFACPDDLDEIERDVFTPLGGRLFIAEKRDQAEHLVPATRFALDRSRMGSETLHLLLAPPLPLENMVFRGVWFDQTRSHVIEVGRSYIKDGRIRGARFWFEPKPFIDGQRCPKPPEFTTWASAVFRRTKKVLVRQTALRGSHESTDWYGRVAGHEVALGTLQPLLN